MTQSNNRLLDELAKLMTDAAGAAQGIRREVETLMKAQAERLLRDLDLVQREEFEAVKEMAAKAREENERLSARVAGPRKRDRSAAPAGVIAPQAIVFHQRAQSVPNFCRPAVSTLPWPFCPWTIRPPSCNARRHAITQ